MRGVTVEGLIYVKVGHSTHLVVARLACRAVAYRTAVVLLYPQEDLLIPQSYTFYDFIVTKARGKSGPLFSFDVHDDVRMMNDATIEKDESHAGKVILRYVKQT